jgi:hypothetical protein
LLVAGNAGIAAGFAFVTDLATGRGGLYLIWGKFSGFCGSQCSKDQESGGKKRH